MRHFLVYAVIRLGLWAVIWWVLTLVDVGVMLAGVLAALIAMLISILFLGRLRDRAAMRWKDAHERRVEQRGEPVDEDADYEDSLLDDGEGEARGAAADDAARAADASNAAAGSAELPVLDNEPAQAPEAARPADAPAGTGPAELPVLDNEPEAARPADAPAGSESPQTPQGPVRGSDR